MTKEEGKLLIEALTLLLAIVASIAALVQWRRDQSWKRAEKLDSMFKEFESNRLIQIACRILDWNRGKFSFPDGDKIEFEHEDVVKSLVLHDEVKECTFTQTQARMRDAYDSLLSFFDRLESAIDGGLVDGPKALRLFGYWIQHLDKMPEHQDCGQAAMKYIARYGSLGSFDSLCGRIGR